MSAKGFKADLRLGVEASVTVGIHVELSGTRGTGGATVWDDGATTWDDGATVWDYYPSDIAGMAALATTPQIAAQGVCFSPILDARGGIHATATCGASATLRIDETPKLLVLTSRPYPVEVIEAAEHVSGWAAEYPYVAYIEAAEMAGGGVVAGEFRASIYLYGNWPYEELQSNGGGVEAGEFRAPLRGYTWPAEELESTGGGVEAGVFDESLITYNNYPAEELQVAGGGVIEGVHE